jgi:hypothetical protein
MRSRLAATALALHAALGIEGSDAFVGNCRALDRRPALSGTALCVAAPLSCGPGVGWRRPGEQASPLCKAPVRSDPATPHALALLLALPVPEQAQAPSFQRARGGGLCLQMRREDELGAELIEEELAWYEEQLALYEEDAGLLCGYARFQVRVCECAILPSFVRAILARSSPPRTCPSL